jgi:purine-nucleoside phosphorylase
VSGKLEGVDALVMQGRAHHYEGHSMGRVTFPIRVMQFLGVDTLIVTNAAGGLNLSFRAGDVMLIRDHINLIGMAGQIFAWAERFIVWGAFLGMSQAYDSGLRALAQRVARDHGIELREGVYICLGGPSFETPADVRFLRLIGADAVGMSTVPEVTVARHGGVRVLGLSGISNMLPPEGVTHATTHEDVLEAGRTPRFWYRPGRPARAQSIGRAWLRSSAIEQFAVVLYAAPRRSPGRFDRPGWRCARAGTPILLEREAARRAWDAACSAR